MKVYACNIFERHHLRKVYTRESYFGPKRSRKFIPAKVYTCESLYQLSIYLGLPAAVVRVSSIRVTSTRRGLCASCSFVITSESAHLYVCESV